MDEVLCDVVPLDACELLLGKPYIYYRDAQSKVKPHEFRLKKGGKTFVLKEYLPPKEALAIVSAKQAGKCIKQTGAYALFIVRPQAPSQERVNLQAQVTSLQAQSKPELPKLQHEYVTTSLGFSSKSPRCSRIRCVPRCCVPLSTDVPRLYVLTSLAYALFDVPSFPAAVPP